MVARPIGESSWFDRITLTGKFSLQVNFLDLGSLLRKSILFKADRFLFTAKSMNVDAHGLHHCQM